MKLLKFLEENKITMAEFAKDLGSSRQSIWNYCQPFYDSNMQIPRPNKIKKIHALTNGKVSIVDFYTPDLEVSVSEGKNEKSTRN
tara:strand:- start:111 stop:365 length:255 start_codon:yes stop_codon:yes gene_type:complete